ncbi:MAG TPA: 2-aminoethylphosphonate--pyruvate transaminase [Verrucomicrobiales bacterium]|nr:2-aminoethylphosphonate--pyruvate transaminase [Verrucomicrobiales bacterium]
MKAEDENPYLLLTPGPLSTTPAVRRAMLRDWCTWDEDYNAGVVTPIREALARLVSAKGGYTSVLMQGSGTFSTEAAIGTALPPGGRLLVLSNGAYGKRLAQIAARLRISHVVHDSGELRPPDLARLERQLRDDPGITHVVMAHVETTTGMLNPVREAGRIVRDSGRCFLVDAMSSFGGIPMDAGDWGIDFLISSANKCIQGVPGFGFVLARRSELERTQGWARSLALDLYDQWRTMEDGRGKWRYTSPTHTVRAFAEALRELEEEGGVTARYARYCENQRILAEGMEGLGFSCLLPAESRSPVITSFLSPGAAGYEFRKFYGRLKGRGFVIYPGKVTHVDTFRIGTIGNVYPEDMRRLLKAVEESMDW